MNIVTGIALAVFVAMAALTIPVLNSLISRKKQKNPEVYISRYGTYVGGCLLKFYNKRDGSFITQAVVSEDTFPHIELELMQSSTGKSMGGMESPFGGTHLSKRKFLIPNDLVAEGKAVCEPLSASFTYAHVKESLPKAAD